MKFEFTFSNPSEQPVVVASSLVEKFLYLQDFLSDEKLGSHPSNAPFSEPSQQDEESVLTVPVGDKISRYVFLKVLEFATHHQGDPIIPEEAEKIFRKSLELDSWDEQFCNVDQKTLYDLILAANFLNYKQLLNVTCKSVANMIRGKTPEEIRQTFNIENDLTPEEEERIRKENEWCLS